MGSHFTSLHVRHTDQHAVAAVVEALVRGNKEARALVGPVLNGWVGVYPNDAIGLEEFSAAVSERTNATALMLVLHDSSLILYHHLKSGKLVDEYSSEPDYFEQASPEEHERLKGRPGLFGPLVDSQTKVQAIASLLRRKADAFEEGRFESLAKLVDIQNASTSYEYLTHGDTHGVTRRKEFIHVPDLTAEKAERKAARAAIRAELKRLKASGILCLDLRPKNLSFAVAAAFDPLHGGLLLNLNTFYRRPGEKLSYLKPPWTDEAEPLDLGVGMPPASFTFSRSGRWLAGHDDRLLLWDWPERKLVHKYETDLSPIEFSVDENFLLCRSSKGFTVVSAQTGEIMRTAKATVSRPEELAWHPDGRFVVTRPRQDQLGIVDLSEGKTIKVLYSGQVQDWSMLSSVFEETWKGNGFSEQQMAAIAQEMISGTDILFRARFSPSGRLLFCATSGGLRIFEWEKLLGAEKTTSPPLYATSPLKLGAAPRVDGDAQSTDYTYDVVLDEAAKRVVFCDIQGTVWFLNLEDKRSGALLKPPERNATWSILLSPDRQHLCCMSTEGDDKKARLQIWNYQKLLAIAGA